MLPRPNFCTMPQPSESDMPKMRKLPTVSEVLELMSPDARRVLREVVLLAKSGRRPAPICSGEEASRASDVPGLPEPDPDARARGTGA